MLKYFWYAFRIVMAFVLLCIYSNHLVITEGQMVVNSTSNTKVAASSESGFAIGPIIGCAIGGIVLFAGAVYALMCSKARIADENRIVVSESSLQNIYIAESKKAGTVPTVQQVKIEAAKNVNPVVGPVQKHFLTVYLVRFRHPDK